MTSQQIDHSDLLFDHPVATIITHCKVFLVIKVGVSCVINTILPDHICGQLAAAWYLTTFRCVHYCCCVQV